MKCSLHGAAAAPIDAARRRWLRRSSTALAASLGAGSLANLLLGTRVAHAADYKALVCIFLNGGNDGMNMVLPTDDKRYGQYAAVRAALALPQSSLRPLSGSSYGLHPSLASLQPLWDKRQLVPVFNVGPLYAPLSKTEYLGQPAGSPMIPDSLFSHADQQVLWESGNTDGLSRTGWGGRACEAMATVNPVISFGGNARFGAESLRMPLVLPGPGALFGATGLPPAGTGWTPDLLRRQAVDAMYANHTGMELRDAHIDLQNGAFTTSERLGPLVASVPGDALSSPVIDAAFAPLMRNGVFVGPLAPQLYQAAKMIWSNSVVQGNRQMFFASLGGFDTHLGQLTRHAELMKELGDSMAAFQTALTNLGLASAVTTFTQSDFGRTFAPNLSGGTDHAWGNHHLVMGGALLGRKTYGVYPELALGGSDDVGQESWELQGRWIPTSSVDQYAATLLRWFGSSESQLDSVLPNLVNFGSKRTLGFL
ncbi:MAG TPA: DUF1501 domain-containing protein [Ideonella sp.]|nr:DUF1501 domain-containing protein [Ideonella sp.]